MKVALLGAAGFGVWNRHGRWPDPARPIGLRPPGGDQRVARWGESRTWTTDALRSLESDAPAMSGPAWQTFPSRFETAGARPQMAMEVTLEDMKSRTDRRGIDPDG